MPVCLNGIPALRRSRFAAALLLAIAAGILAAETPGQAGALGERTAGPTTAFTGGRNILTNGGFEDGVKGWNPSKGQELATGQDVAHTGDACMTGEVSRPNQALRLRRTIPARTTRGRSSSTWNAC